MKNLVSKWLADRVALSGLLGCGAGQPGCDCICQSTDETVCPSEKLEKILSQVEVVSPPPAADGLPPRWQTWVFAQGKIRSVTRPDGWTLVAVVRADSVAVNTLDMLGSEFLALTPGN